MTSNKSTLIEFTNSNPPRVTSHKSWEEVYEMIGSNYDNHPDPYFIETNGMTVILCDDGDGQVSATLRTSEKAMMQYQMFGGVWVKLSD